LGSLYHKVGIRLEDSKNKEVYDFVEMVGFTRGGFPSTLPQQTAILGTIGFFNHLNIRFSYPIEIQVNI